MDGGSFRLVTFDIDGTLTTRHGWRPIAEATGRVAAYERSNRRLRAGRETEDAHLERLFELAVGLPTARFEGLLESAPKVRGIAETVEALHRLGLKVGLLSHNPAIVIDWYCERYGFDGGSGGWGLSYADGHVAVPFGVRADKVRGLEELARRFGTPPERTCHVGDAWPDARLAPLLGGFIAFNPKEPRVGAVADAVVRARDLRKVLPILGSLVPRPPVKGALPFAEGSNSGETERAMGVDGVRRP